MQAGQFAPVLSMINPLAGFASLQRLQLRFADQLSGAHDLNREQRS
jgi:hypothetical protein